MSNSNFLQKTKETIRQIRTVGKYNEDIVLLVGNDLKDISIENVIVKFFPEIDRSKEVEIFKITPISDGREIYKTFQFQKIYCFDEFFKQWDICFYIDSGMNIFKPIDKFFELDCQNIILAHSDSYPTYEWTLKNQFNSIVFPELYKELENKYDLNIDYFQSGIMLYDTNIIKNDTKNILIEMSKKWINSKTNEQGIMNLLFNCEQKIWKQITIKDDDTHYYDYWERYYLKYSDYIMLKYPRTKII